MEKDKRKNNVREDGIFHKKVRELAGSFCPLNFTAFIIREMGFVFQTVQELEAARHPAFRSFALKTGRYPFASRPTMRRWFGIGGVAVPDREQVYAICLVLKCGLKKTWEYLTVGLEEVGVQYSDYREFIFLYGLANELSYQKCLKMCGKFLAGQNETIQWEKEGDETFLETEFQRLAGRPAEEFLTWMNEHAECFVGYSREVMNCLARYRSMVMGYIRREAGERLESLLAETDYESWANGRNCTEKSPRERMRKYVNSHRDGNYKISENMKENILELSQIVYSRGEPISRLLGEVFSLAHGNSDKNNAKAGAGIRRVTLKHLSDLYNIPTQKMRAMNTIHALRRIENMGDEERCPDWLKEMSSTYTRAKKKIKTVGDARKWLTEYSAEHRRRCLDVRRSDFLPLIHYVAQHRYLEKLEEHRAEYDAREARQLFAELADETLALCRMDGLNDERELDRILLMCYQQEEMYSYADVLDVAGEEIYNTPALQASE